MIAGDNARAPRPQGFGRFQTFALTGPDLAELVRGIDLQPSGTLELGIAVRYARSPTYPLGAAWLVVIAREEP